MKAYITNRYGMFMTFTLCFLWLLLHFLPLANAGTGHGLTADNTMNTVVEQVDHEE